jgi:hypothetical protein
MAPKEDGMDRAHMERNAAQRARLQALVERLSDDDLVRALAGDWTVAALLAHLAFWDRFVLARWTQAALEGRRVPPLIGDVQLDLINAAALEGWRALPPRAAAQQALSAAEAIERLVAGLADEAVREIQADGRLPLLDRTLHWRGHLDEIEAALDRGTGGTL